MKTPALTPEVARLNCAPRDGKRDGWALIGGRFGVLLLEGRDDGEIVDWL